MSRHNAPPVAYPVQRSTNLGLVLLACWAIGIGVLTLWVSSSPAWGWRAGLAAVVALCAGTAALLSWQKICRGHLTWDGECWHWDALGDLSSSQASTLSVVADVQSALLLLLENPGDTRRWFWIERVSRPERWMDMRRAVYASRREPAPFAPRDHL